MFREINPETKTYSGARDTSFGSAVFAAIKLPFAKLFPVIQLNSSKQQ